ncbi:MAG: hypothetical protein OEV36_10250 [Myxococcales bacterium]|nr:hypothetical protein [Myxococcales bacterium]
MNAKLVLHLQAQPRAEVLQMILVGRAVSTRINWFLAQILRERETENASVLLKAFFSDKRLISPAKRGDWSELIRVEIG